MALTKLKGNLERILDKNLADLVRGIRNNKENEVYTYFLQSCSQKLDVYILFVLFFRSSISLNVLKKSRQSSSKKTLQLKLTLLQSCHMYGYFIYYVANCVIFNVINMFTSLLASNDWL